MKTSPSFSITNKTKRRLPSLPFASIKDAVLGEKYELSLVFCGDALSKKLNKAYRSKNKPTNVLSFSVSKTSGEIFINVSHLKGFTVGNLFIHGLFHLKGFEHGDTMEKRERAVRAKFGV